MRFHSVVFQTILNGKNFVLDYTEPRKGKIIGFVDEVNFPMQRYVNIQESDIPDYFIKKDVDPFYIDINNLSKKLETYNNVLKDLI